MPTDRGDVPISIAFHVQSEYRNRVREVADRLRDRGVSIREVNRDDGTIRGVAAESELPALSRLRGVADARRAWTEPPADGAR